jgi:hypothetical protein
VSADFALPRDLDTNEQIALAREFVQELTKAEQLPYTMAIHAGRDADGHAHNPHAHLMVSERQHDGIDRAREQWFRRANAAHPERGGAPKSRSLHGREWVEQARARWAELTNASLNRAGSQERVDHRSYERQGVDREPGHHYGPAAARMVTRSEPHDRLTAVAEVADERDRLRDVEREIASLEVVRGALVREVEERFGAERGEGSGSSRGGDWSRDGDSHPGR